MSPQSERSRTLILPETCEYSAAERQLLLRLAHDSIRIALEGGLLDVTPPSPHLAEPRGAFTTLHLGGKLRGCIGYVLPADSLYKTVADTARAAAFDDPRFEPVPWFEVPHLKVELSVLSPLQPIEPDEVVVGRHGLVVTQGNHRGLLLPQVAPEWEWNRETFLSQTCRKAGLPPDAWQHGAELQGFTAEVFGDGPGES
jgi:uncharacterized protein